VGDWIVGIEGVRVRASEQDRPDVMFRAPVPSLLMIDFAIDRALRSRALRRAALRGLRLRPDGYREPEVEHESRLLDAISEEAAAVVFSVMAVEAFANGSLSLADADARYRPQAGGPEIGRSRIEHEVPLLEKVEFVLPGLIYQGPGVPADGVIDHLRRVTKVRNALIHPKRNDRYEDEEGRESTLGQLLHGDLVAPRVAADVLTHFVPDFLREQTLRKVRSLEGREDKR
jgi:hypothetical protein